MSQENEFLNLVGLEKTIEHIEKNYLSKDDIVTVDELKEYLNIGGDDNG